MAVVEVRRIDSQDWLILPKSWRERGNEILIVEFEDRIEIISRKKQAFKVL